MAQDKRSTGIRTFVILAVILVLGGFIVMRMRGQNQSATADGTSATGDAKTVLAQCLTDKGVKMFGASWCPHCAAQKKDFGDAFKKVTYVECAVPGDSRGQTQVCKDNKIQGYPTWRFADGSELTGEQTLEDLAEKAGCSYGDTPAPDASAAANAPVEPDVNVSTGGPRAQ